MNHLKTNHMFWSSLLNLIPRWLLILLLLTLLILHLIRVPMSQIHLPLETFEHYVVFLHE